MMNIIILSGNYELPEVAEALELDEFDLEVAVQRAVTDALEEAYPDATVRVAVESGEGVGRWDIEPDSESGVVETLVTDAVNCAVADQYGALMRDRLSEAIAEED